jgi:hypothetical protein
MTDDLQYRQYSDIPYLSLNNSIFSALLRVKDFDSFESDQQSWANKFKLEQSTQEIAKLLGIGEKEESPYAHLLRVFPQCKSFDDLIYRYTLLTNLVKDQYLDLNFKGVYLDKIKC